MAEFPRKHVGPFFKVKAHKEKRRKVKGPTARRRAAKKAKDHRGDPVVYAAVDARDGLRSRYSGVYVGASIHRHHIERRRPGNTTVENVISLSPDEHMGRIHGLNPTLRLKGNANMFGGVEVWEKVNGAWIQTRNI